MHKSITFVTLLVLCVLCGCKNTFKQKSDNTNSESVEKHPKNIKEENDDKEDKSLNFTVMKFTEKEWKEMQISYNKIIHADDNWTEEDGDADMLARVLNSNDISIGGKLRYHVLKQYGFKFIPDSIYIERIKYVFGIDLNNTEHLRSNKLRVYDDYSVYLIPDNRTVNHNYEGCCEFNYNRDNCYFFRKYGIVFYEQPLADIIDMEKSTDKDNVYLYKNDESFHWNNYILYGNKGSLMWFWNLEYDYSETFRRLLYFFGYDKEEKINKSVLNELNKITDPDYHKTFAGWDIEGTLQIREGLLKTVSESTTATFDKYYKVLEAYTRALGDLSDNDTKEFRDEFTPSERRKVLAYTVNILQPLYEHFFMDSSNAVVGVLMNICTTDDTLLLEWEQNNYYGLSHLPRIIELLNKTQK